ncbi:hypothetical protein ACFT7S_30405 [Streptomyces sp. NPDC057136]|uniref:hypothetical protein n=1 Tax=Streptomyces sp. NPDC057136 TaxID=3346029 RepID=UPI0036346B6F
MRTLIPSGPARVVVRQHRRALQAVSLLPVLVIAALVGVLLWTGHIADTFDATDCSTEKRVPGCDQTVRDFIDNQMWLQNALAWAGGLTIVLPALVGAFVAGPLIARELESGTYKLAWTQSVSPARWLAAKLAVPAVLTLAATSVLTAAYAWFRWQQEGSYYGETPWYDRFVYGAFGTVPVAYALLGLALGALAGLLVRRTVVAMSVTVLATGLVVLALSTVRSSLWPVRTQSVALKEFNGFPNDALVVENGWLTTSGTRLPPDLCWDPANDLKECLADHDVTSRYIDYHPVSHFWPLQLVETGILLALAAIAVALAFRVLRRLHS